MALDHPGTYQKLHFKRKKHISSEVSDILRYRQKKLTTLYKRIKNFIGKYFFLFRNQITFALKTRKLLIVLSIYPRLQVIVCLCVNGFLQRYHFMSLQLNQQNDKIQFQSTSIFHSFSISLHFYYRKATL